MPLLGVLIIGMFDLIIGFFARFMVLEKALRLSSWAIALSLIGVLIGVLFAAAGTLTHYISQMANGYPYLAMGLGMVINSGTIACVGVYMGVHIASHVYIVRKKSLNMLLG